MKARFFSRWIACQDAYLRTEAARAFHLASVAFVIGLLTSIGVRGIGTAYTVGWESTWLGNHPEWISVILRSLYDLVPLDRLGGAAWPDLSVIADLRFDRVSQNLTIVGGRNIECDALFEAGKFPTRYQRKNKPRNQNDTR